MPDHRAALAERPSHGHHVETDGNSLESMFGHEAERGSDDASLFLRRDGRPGCHVFIAPASLDFDEHQRAVGSNSHQVEFASQPPVATSDDVVAVSAEVACRCTLARSPQRLARSRAATTTRSRNVGQVKSTVPVDEVVAKRRPPSVRFSDHTGPRIRTPPAGDVPLPEV